MGGCQEHMYKLLARQDSSGPICWEYQLVSFDLLWRNNLCLHHASVSSALRLFKQAPSKNLENKTEKERLQEKKEEEWATKRCAVGP